MALTNRGGRSSARAVVLTRGYGDRTARRSCQKGTVTPTTPASSTKKQQSLKERSAARRAAVAAIPAAVPVADLATAPRHGRQQVGGRRVARRRTPAGLHRRWLADPVRRRRDG